MRNIITILVTRPHIALFLALFLCVISLASGIEQTGESYHRQSDTVQTNGIVIYLDRGEGSSSTAGPVVGYFVNGVTYTCRGSVSIDFRNYKVGDHVPVRYKRVDPSEACIDTFYQQWLSPLVFSLVGLLGGAGCIYGIVRWRRKSRDNNIAKMIRNYIDTSDQSK